MSSVILPKWACVSDRRRAHIQRATELIDLWARKLNLSPALACSWHDAARWHDALRDAPEQELRAIVGDDLMPAAILHGPAAAIRLAAENERRQDVLEAIRHHTVGCASWESTGRALYMADFLEPGRIFLQQERAKMAERVPSEFDLVFAEVVRLRVERAVRTGKQVSPQTQQLYEAATSGRLSESGVSRDR
jgi:HD superfamily phosphohydrolase YqeK